MTAEIRRVLLATLYFLVGFNLLVVLIGLLAPGTQTLPEMMLTATLLALVVGKVVVLAEGPIDRVVRRKGSFLAAVSKRAALFTLVVLIALALEAVVHGMLGESLRLKDAFHHALEEASGARFSARALYLMVLFSLYALLFELDAYFAPRRLSDVVASRFGIPHTADVVTMRVGLADAIDPPHVEARLRLVEKLYAAFDHQAKELGAELDLFGGFRGVLIWEPADAFNPSQAERAYQAISELLREEAQWWEAQTGVPPRLKAVVTRGALHTMEIGVGRRRQILRSGPCLERAEERFRELDEATLFFDTTLEGLATTGDESAA